MEKTLQVAKDSGICGAFFLLPLFMLAFDLSDVRA